MASVVEITAVDDGHYLVSRAGYRHEGLLLHGYGGNKEEMLGLATKLAADSRLRLVICDLPGHGHSLQELSLASARAAVEQASTLLNTPSFFIGHSMGARLGLMSGLPIGVLISMPGAAVFEGDRKESLRTLRPQRVKESSLFHGLREILAIAPSPPEETLMLRADREIKSAVDMASQWSASGIPCHRIPGSDHLDIVNCPETARIIGEWLDERLP